MLTVSPSRLACGLLLALAACTTNNTTIEQILANDGGGSDAGTMPDVAVDAGDSPDTAVATSDAGTADAPTSSDATPALDAGTDAITPDPDSGVDAADAGPPPMLYPGWTCSTPGDTTNLPICFQDASAPYYASTQCSQNNGGPGGAQIDCSSLTACPPGYSLWSACSFCTSKSCSPGGTITCGGAPLDGGPCVTTSP
jgi:hypothetical protein